MASKTNKLLINAADFPFTYAHAQRSAIEGNDIAPRMPGQFYGDKINADYGAPQLVYCENVLPFNKGIYSVGFSQQVAAIPAGIITADTVIALRDASERIFTFVPARGGNYIYSPITATWASVTPFAFTASLITRAYINGRTFICYEKSRILEYNAVTGLLVSAPIIFPAGTTMANVRGIGGASNYLLLFTELEILWCSPLNVMDFSSIDAGAGQQVPIEIRGQITAILPISGGFIAYTARNAIGATFTNNANAPFIFKEVINCGGVASWEQVATDAAETGHYLWGTHGLQLANLTAAVAVHPALTDFLLGGQMETWNPATKRVDRTTGAGTMSVKLATVSGRWLIISYGLGTTGFSHAVIYDEALRRWGKVCIDHVAAFLYPYPSGTGDYTYDTLPGTYADLTKDYLTLSVLFIDVIPAKKGIAFLKSTGQILVLTPDFTQVSSSGVAVFGHIAYKNDEHTTIHLIELDGLRSTPAPVVTIMSSKNGKDRDRNVTPTLLITDNEYRRYGMRVTDKNHDIAIEGNFVLTNLFADVMHHGYR